MKKMLVFLAFLIVPLALLAQDNNQLPPSTAAVPPVPGAGTAQARQIRVAIFDFDYSTVQSGTDALFNTNVDVGKGIRDLLVKYLVKDGTYFVIDRAHLDKIMAEQNFSNSDRANPTSAARLGKLLGVDVIITGSVTQFGEDTKNRNIGGVGGNWGGWGNGGVGHKSTKAIVGLDAQIVDIDTGQILAVAEGHGESSRSSTSLLGGGGNWHSWGGGNVDFGDSNFQQTILGEAVNQAVQQMSTEVIADNSKLHPRLVIVEGLVADVEGGQVILNVGAKAGLKVGDQLSIERVTKVIKDPATGAVIRKLTAALGIVEVTEVDENSSVCRVVSGSGFQTGDAAKTVTQ
jgi:curli biogenesis system outer membrane secretion channel CsgG